MYCISCGAVNPDYAKFCHQCGKATESEPQDVRRKCSGLQPLGSGTTREGEGTKAGSRGGSPDDNKAREARQSVIIASVACLVAAAVSLYQAFAAKDVVINGTLLPGASIRSGSVVGIVLYSLLAWGLWARNSLIAGILAFVLLCIYGLAFLLVAIMTAVAGHNEVTLWIVVLVAFVAAWRALDGTRQMRRLAREK
jgi:hypothetical protein